MDHPMIYRLVVQESPSAPAAVSAAAAELWAEAKELILRVDERIRRAMDRSSDGWEGSAADSTRSAMSPLAQWAVDAAGDATLTAEGVELQAFQATYVRNAMPVPDPGAIAGEPGDLPRGDPAWILTDQAARENEAANKAARAVELMEHYTAISYEARSYMDYWTTPPQVTVEVAPVSPSGGGTGVEGWGDAGVTSVGAAAAAPTGSGPTGAGVGNVGPVGLGPGAGAATAGAGASGAADGLAGTSGGVAGTPGAAGTGAPPAGRRSSAGAAATAGGPIPGIPGLGGPGVRAGASSRSAIGTPAGRAASVPGSLPRGGAPGTGTGFRPVVPGPPARSAPAPSWRDVVRGNAEALPPPRSSAGPVRGPGGFGEASPAPGRGAGSPFPTATAAGGSSGTARPGHPPMMAPMTGAAGGPEREHRRPSYLVDDTDAFADDRWVTLPVMSPDDPLPRPPR